MQLSLSLLGSFSLKIDGQTVPESRTQKNEALLTYLVVESDRTHRREQLMGVLFPKVTTRYASENLRQTLSRLRRAIKDKQANPSFLIISRESVGFNLASSFYCDLHDFERRLLGCQQHENQRDNRCPACLLQMEQAIDLYRGDFLTGLSLATSNVFERWAATQRKKLRQEAIETLDILVQIYLERGDYEKAIDTVRRLITIDPLNEVANQQLMRLLARTGKRTQALERYKKLAQQFKDELGVEPEPMTTALRDQIISLPYTERPHQLPSADGHFVGRQEMLAQIHSHFAANKGRLLTLVGGGGIGKTRLAVEAGWRVVRDKLGPFMHGVYFVSLETSGNLPDAEKMLAMAIADSLGLSVYGNQNPLDVVLGFLTGKELLLILDNCEEAGPSLMLLPKLLHQVPGLQILATSREPLGLTLASFGRLIFSNGRFCPTSHTLIKRDQEANQL
ncbi:MAG: BTAD domain-containing putative transcriptional regulator [Chloroflexota bacterium]